MRDTEFAAGSTAMRHVVALADGIGPRGSTTDGEREAAEYARTAFEEAGLKAVVEPFTSTVSGWRPFALAAFSALFATTLALVLPGSWAVLVAALLLVVTASVFLEMYFRANPLRLFIPKGASQNVWARVGPTKGSTPGQETGPVLLVAHIDTHRTPWVFKSPGRLRFFKTMTTLGVAAFILSALLMVASAFSDAAWLRTLLLLLTPVHLIVLALTFQPDTTPYTAGANDNASGVGVLLSLARRLAEAPLENNEVWLLASGCEEVGSVGMQAFLKEHLSELKNGYGISIDNVGGAGAGVCYTSVEGMVFPLKPSPELYSLAEELSGERPELDAYSLPYTTLHTDATCLMASGVPSLSFVGLTREGRIPDWHQASDVVEKVDASTILKTEEFVWKLLQKLDGDA